MQDYRRLDPDSPGAVNLRRDHIRVLFRRSRITSPGVTLTDSPFFVGMLEDVDRFFPTLINEAADLRKQWTVARNEGRLKWWST